MEGENPDELATSIIPKYLPLSFKDENKREILSEEVIRLMIQTLDDLGLKKSAKTLQEESHVLFEDEYVINFRKYILEGKWDTVHEIIPKLNIQNEIYKSTVEFLIYEQQYLELLELRNFTEALSLLQSQLTPIATSLSAYYLQIETSTNYTTPLNPPSPTPTPSSPATPLSPLSPASSNSKSLSESKGFVNTLHHLSTLIMCRSAEELREKAKWSGSFGTSRSDLITKLHEYVPPSIMIPQRRLSTLLMQAVTQQEYNCLYHNVRDYSVQLLADHTCHQFLMPKTNIVFTGHKDEVWFAQFSHNGKYLATASKDNTIIIWSVKPNSMGKIIHTLAVSGVTSYIDWSSDNSKLLSCTSKFIYVWDAITGSCINTFSNPNSKGDIQTIAWFPNNLSFVSGGRGQFITSHSLQGEEIKTWEASNIIDIIINRDASLMIATSHEMKIHIFDLHSNSSEVIQEIACITSISLSRDSRYLLTSLVTREVHLWDIANKKLIQKYHGGFGKPYQHYIRSCFGGVNESFILSGSEESGVYVWNRHQGNLLTVLEGHTKMVNSVCWNYGSQNMFASVSDDCTVRIWIFDSTYQS